MTLNALFLSGNSKLEDDKANLFKGPMHALTQAALTRGGRVQA